ncbi:MAG: site-specific integrase [Candidatus Sulfotelmatobacter sp.]
MKSRSRAKLCREVRWTTSLCDEVWRPRSDSIPSPHRPLAHTVALHTGMRPSEQYGLTWDRVDLLRQHVTIPKSKNGKVRHVRLNSAAVAAFKILRKRSFKILQKRSLSGVAPVFVNIQGEPLQGYKHWFDPAVAEAGLKDFTWYCLRHTFASRLTMAGGDLRTLAELMGHQTIQMTMRYAHLAPSHTLAAVERLVAPSVLSPDALRESRTATRTATGHKGSKEVIFSDVI